MSSNKRDIVSIAIAHHSCSAELLGAYSLGEDSLSLAREIALKEDNVDEVFAISTCNRVEFFVVGEKSAALRACENAISLNGTRDMELLRTKALRFENLDAIVHLFEVACGLDSQMLGENEILGQIKKAYSNASAKGHCGQILNRTLQKTIQCAKWIRTNTAIGSGNTTVGAVAAEVAMRIFEDLAKVKILLVGSGEVGRSTALSLAARGAQNITVASRTWQNAHTLSADVGGNAIGFERVHEELWKFDIAIFSLASAEHFITKASAIAANSKRPNAPIFLIDMGVPHNIDSECAKLDGVFLYRLSDLSRVANENLELRIGEIENARKEILLRASSLWKKICE